MAIQRVFLDWQQPALAAAAEHLRERFQGDGALDLSGLIVVVPGGRAGRRLLELLVDAAERNTLLLTPPEIVTPERFPELLYEAKRPFADLLTQQLAWTEALRRSPRDVLAPFLPFPPPADDTPRWLAIGETLRRLHLELAGDGLDCAKVLEGASCIEGFVEHDRWQTLCKLQRLYLDTLDQFQLWDVQTARLVAIEKREIATDKQIVLVATVDLNRTQRQILDQVAERVTALIAAPKKLAARFDEHGCLVPSQWTEFELPLVDEQIERVDGPAEQAEAVTRWLASLGGRYRADEIAIGMPDEKLVPHIERELTQAGITPRWAIRKELAETAPFRLLKIAAEYCTRRRFRDLAAIVRHADVYEWVRGQRSEVRGQNSAFDVLEALDRYASESFPAQLDAERLKKDENAAEVAALYQVIETLIAPLAMPPQALATWAEPLRAVLATIYGTRELNRDEDSDRYLFESLTAIARALDTLANVPAALQPAVDARQACRMALSLLSGEGIPPTADPDSIELLGWLDLPLDDAPATIVTTFNEGYVPSSATADVFLPNRLRESLGLLHNDQRLARDAYATSLLVASRREMKVIVARRDTEGNPLSPSRLLFLTEPDRVVERACCFFGPLDAQPRRRNLLVPPGSPPPKRKLQTPQPERLSQAITALSVTRFRDYLACPYRFYLRHVLKLQSLSDEGDELDGGAFGGLVHTVLEQLGKDEAKPVRYESRAEKIEEYLCDRLDAIAGARFGKHLARPAVLVQLEQIRLRLKAFARWQATRNRDGWRIVFSEDSQEPKSLQLSWPVDGQPFTLHGRIDRIDFHETQRKLCVVDYKTADRGDKPQQTHRKGDEWIDLQLPLYRHLVRSIKLPPGVPADAPVELGYIVLPLDLKSVDLLLAEWDEPLLASADEKARDIVRAIRAEKFWPPTTPAPDFFDDVAVICQDRRMGGWLAEDAA
jgi:RecB family exonuclease